MLLITAALTGAGTFVGAQGTVPASAKAPGAKLETRTDAPQPQTKGKKVIVPRKIKKAKAAS